MPRLWMAKTKDNLVEGWLSIGCRYLTRAGREIVEDACQHNVLLAEPTVWKIHLSSWQFLPFHIFGSRVDRKLLYRHWGIGSLVNHSHPARVNLPSLLPLEEVSRQAEGRQGLDNQPRRFGIPKHQDVHHQPSTQASENLQL